MATYQVTIHRPGSPSYTVRADDREQALDRVAESIAKHSTKNGLPNVIADGRVLIQALNLGECYITRNA